MTLREWLDAYAHNSDAQLICAWRKRALRAMRPVVEQFLVQRDHGVSVYAGDLFAAIDSAGVAAGIPKGGKRWRQERAQLEKIVQHQRELWAPPTRDEAGACEVAQDLYELGKDAEAESLLAEQAPNRHSRRCPACGAKPGQPCRKLHDGISADEMRVPHAARLV